MAESNKPSSSDTHTPPPPDPFPTYQTPYPRHTSDNENPFISFRRFADEQFNSLFSGLPRILTASGPQIESEIKQTLEERSQEQAARFESDINRLMRHYHEEAEGFRKQIEQEREERRMENEKRKEEHDVRWAAMQREIERRSSPVRDTNDPATELDMYDRIEEDRHNSNSQRRECRWKHDGRRGWLSGLGWDGKGKLRNAHNEDTTKPAVQHDLRPLNLEPEQHLADLEPFKHEDDLQAYLTQSKYSPVHLMVPNYSPVWRTRSSEEGATSAANAGPTNDLEQRMADHLPWSEAFNDLLSLEKTGVLPPRNSSLFSIVPFRAFSHGPFGDQFSREMERLTEKTPRREAENDGKLREGDFWDGDIDISPLGTGIMALLLGAALSGVPTRCIRNSQEKPQQIPESDQYEDSEPRSDELGIRGIFWPGPEAVLSLIDHAKQLELEANPQGQAIEDEAQEQPAVPNNVSSRSSSAGMSSQSTSDNTANNNNSISIISTLTTTQTRTLPDGTTETKRVLKRRFADGREECDESVEVRPGSTPTSNLSTIIPRRQDQAPTTNDQIQKMPEFKHKEKEPKKQCDKSSEGKSGWFWN